MIFTKRKSLKYLGVKVVWGVGDCKDCNIGGTATTSFTINIGANSGRSSLSCIMSSTVSCK